MRRLLLFRHAKSDWGDAALGDHARPLARRGRTAAPAMGRWIAQQQPWPDLVLCSTATRTRETWAYAKAAFDPAPPVKFERRIYEAQAEDVLGAVRETGEEVRTLLLIGHNPGLEDLAAMLVGTGESEARGRLGEKFPTAAVAVLEFDDAPWAGIEPRSGVLAAFATPKLLGIDGG